MLLIPACALLVSLGCGPMQAPLPERLDPESQKKIDDAWASVLTPPDRLGHQDLLDVLVGTQAYQLGVDSFMFRAEKRYAGGKVVMEVAFDRARPDEDRFQVTVLDSLGKVARAENYTRKEVDETFDTLYRSSAGQPGPRNDAAQRRWERIWSHFPKPEERKAEEAAKPRQKG
jgi:hypothetical protein